MYMYSLFQITGVVGSVFVIWGFLISQKKEFSRARYNVINIFGAILLLISLYENQNHGSILIEVFWISISIFYFFKALKEDRAKKLKRTKRYDKKIFAKKTHKK